MAWWQYLLLVNLYLVLFYTFYALLLRRETFFQLNRLYLVSSVLLAFIIPLIHADWVTDLFITRQVQHTLSVYTAPELILYYKHVPSHNITAGQLLLLAYLTGITVTTIKLAIRMVSLKQIITLGGKYGPFSFFNIIDLGRETANLEIITVHEQVHARQWHSADVLLAELITIINWFNPITYLYKTAIKQTHEFIADRKAVESGTSKADYALLLLSHTLNTPAHQLVNSFFNNSLLKKCIIMLQKNRSQKGAIVKYGLSAPLFILMLILSSATIGNNKTVRLINIKAASILSAPASSLNTPHLQPAETAPHAVTPADTGKTGSRVFVAVQTTPSFKGGIQAFYQFLAQNIKYPEAMKKNNVQGKVFVTFIVEKDGSLSNIKILRDIGYGAGEESVRVLQLSPKWNPGLQNGKAVRVQYTLPINFALADSGHTTGKVQNSNKTDSAEYASGKGWGNSTSVKGFESKPLYLVDGKEADVTKLKASDIESIDVLKPTADNSLVEKYGEKAKNGVILIKMKRQ